MFDELRFVLDASLLLPGLHPIEHGHNKRNPCLHRDWYDWTAARIFKFQLFSYFSGVCCLFCFLVSFFWMNTMCTGIWLTFRLVSLCHELISRFKMSPKHMAAFDSKSKTCASESVLLLKVTAYQITLRVVLETRECLVTPYLFTQIYLFSFY